MNSLHGFDKRLAIGEKYVKEKYDESFCFSQSEKEKIADILKELVEYMNLIFMDRRMYFNPLGEKKRFIMNLNTLLLPLFACEKTTKDDMESVLESFLDMVVIE